MKTTIGIQAIAILIGISHAGKAVISAMTIKDKLVTSTQLAVMEDILKATSTLEVSETIGARDIRHTMDLTQAAWEDQVAAMDLAALATAMEHRATTQEVNMVLADTAPEVHMDHLTEIEISMTEIIRE